MNEKLKLLAEIEELIDKKKILKASNDFADFAKYMKPDNSYIGFHDVYYKVLDMFAKGLIKKLIVTVPPQHGKSEGSTRLLPAYLLGINPNLRIAVSSYAGTLAQDFNREIQKIIDTENYNKIFPKTTLTGSDYAKKNATAKRTTDAFEIVGYNGELRSVGRDGGLTGKPVDIMIQDDLYKNYEEANSPTIRNSVIKFYTTVVKTRLHNNSQELIVFTRWHEDDLIGWIEKMENVITINSYSDVETIKKGDWIKINFEALKESERTEIDKRERWDALFPERHDKEKLLGTRSLDVENFNCLYQGNPMSSEGMLYGSFKTYTDLPEFKIIKNQTDTADKGKDYLCSINYGLPLNPNDNHIYVLDWVYSDSAMEITEPLTIDLIKRGNVNIANIESNNGGRGFARTVEKEVKAVVEWFHQSANKESKIISNSAKVMREVVFPADWSTKDITFYNHLTRFKRLFKANTQDGIPDVLSEIVMRNETSLSQSLNFVKEIQKKGHSFSVIVPSLDSNGYNAGIFVYLYENKVFVKDIIYTKSDMLEDCVLKSMEYKTIVSFVKDDRVGSMFARSLRLKYPNVKKLPIIANLDNYITSRSDIIGKKFYFYDVAPSEEYELGVNVIANYKNESEHQGLQLCLTLLCDVIQRNKLINLYA